MWYLSIKLIIAAAFLLFFILIYCTSVFEKRVLHQFVPVDRSLLKDPSPYFTAVNEFIRQAGYTYVGTYLQNRNSKVYQAYFSLWLSPDATILARVVGGKTLGVTLRKTILLSYLDDGSLLECSDDPLSPDLSGLTDRNLLMRAHFPELLGFHLKKLTQKGVAARLFKAETAFQVHETFEAIRVDRMEELGLARYVNADRTIWRNTSKGAFRNYSGLRESMRMNSGQSDRIRLKRPGDA